MWTIAGLTFKEIARKKILLITFVLSLAYLSLYGTALHYAYKQIDKMSPGVFESMVIPQLLTAGLFFASMIISMLAIFSGAGAISGDIESGVAHAIIPRPVRRSRIVLGKFAGIGGMLLLYGLLLYSALIALVYVQTGYKVVNVVQAGVYFLFQPLVLLSLSMLGTTLFSSLANGIAVFILYGMSIMGGIVEQVGGIIKSDTLLNIGIISGLLVPVDVLYRKMVAILFSASSNLLAGFQTLGPFGVQSEPSYWMTVYAILYCLAMLTLALRIFGRKDI
ncbi:MAG: hypothetical protein VR69_13400 [Peptococcaceae bacterium BRH_c4b]|nr:MAG: hypothetical protein VR69_13400 [Peptococcaceae bacterium BRH_c4b]